MKKWIFVLLVSFVMLAGAAEGGTYWGPLGEEVEQGNGGNFEEGYMNGPVMYGEVDSEISGGIIWSLCTLSADNITSGAVTWEITSEAINLQALPDFVDMQEDVKQIKHTLLALALVLVSFIIITFARKH